MTQTITLHHWLNQHTATPPQCLFVLTNETLFQTQVTDTYRKRLRQTVDYQRHVLEQNKEFNHQYFLSLLAESSLFGDTSLIELRLTQTKLNNEFVKTLEQVGQWITNGQLSHYLMITGPNLNKSQLASPGFKSLTEHFCQVVCPTITLENMPNWLIQSAERQNIKFEYESAKWLAEQTEGNLLAAQQCIDKCTLEQQSDPASSPVVPFSTVQKVATAACRFHVFDLSKTLLAGNQARTIKILQGLHAEGEASTLVLWALTEEIKTIIQVKQALQKGQSLKQTCLTYRVWGERQKHISSACARHSANTLNNLLKLCYKAEKTIKGLTNGSPWHQFEIIALGIAGHQPFFNMT